MTEIEFGHSRIGISRQKVFPLLVPAVMMLSCPFMTESKGRSWKGRGTIVKRVMNVIMRYARSASVLSISPRVAKYSTGSLLSSNRRARSSSGG